MPTCHGLRPPSRTQRSDNLPRLTEFTGRFRARFVELMSDVDAAVAAEGLRLLAQLVKTKQVRWVEGGGPWLPCSWRVQSTCR